MGEMADYVNELIEQDYESLYDWRSGRINAEEAMDMGVIDEFGSEYGSYPKTKTCRCCGENGLVWGQYDGKWRLFSGNQLHRCPENPLVV